MQTNYGGSSLSLPVAKLSGTSVLERVLINPGGLGTMNEASLAPLQLFSSNGNACLTAKCLPKPEQDKECTALVHTYVPCGL